MTYTLSTFLCLSLPYLSSIEQEIMLQAFRLLHNYLTFIMVQTNFEIKA